MLDSTEITYIYYRILPSGLLAIATLLDVDKPSCLQKKIWIKIHEHHFLFPYTPRKLYNTRLSLASL